VAFYVVEQSCQTTVQALKMARKGNGMLGHRNGEASGQNRILQWLGNVYHDVTPYICDILSNGMPSRLQQLRPAHLSSNLG
jgi:hypothetical protein